MKDDSLLVWETAQQLATKGSFEELQFVARPEPGKSLSHAVGSINSQANRLVVLDPREWTLLNGVDETSRVAVRRMLGVGPGALVVDNAASCVIALLNTQRRRYAVQAAESVLTWKLVLSQSVDDDERTEVTRQIGEAEKILKTSVRSAFQHYAYLIRRGDDLDVYFARFDDDKMTSLSGNDVWGALVQVGRAVGEYFDHAEKRRKRLLLGEAYVAALLGSFDRHLTLKDITTSFYQNPAFPLVPSIAEVRQVIYDLIQPTGHKGDGTGGWEIIDGAGTRLEPLGPGQLAINSIQQQIRRVKAATSVTEPVNGNILGGSSGSGTATSEDTATGKETGRSISYSDSGTASTSVADSAAAAASYSWYQLEIVNRSIADPTKRDTVRKVLVWLASRLDDDTLDSQLITLRVELNAITSDDLIQELRQRAKDIEANKWSVEESL